MMFDKKQSRSVAIGSSRSVKSIQKKVVNSTLTSAKGKGKQMEQLGSDQSRQVEMEVSEEEEDDDRAAMLAALEAHGRMLFGLGDAGTTSRSSEKKKSEKRKVPEEDEDEEDEDENDYHTDDGWGGEGAVGDDTDDYDEDEDDDEEEDEKFPKPINKTQQSSRVPEVVFAPCSSTPSSNMISKSERKAFLTGHSAKMMGIPTERETVIRKRPRTKQEEEEDKSNLELDKSLHQMLLTTLLPTVQADSASRPVDKRNAISGRLLELASYSLPGEGSTDHSSTSLSSHPAHVRTGLLHAQQRRDAKSQAEAKAAGSWVKGAGGLGDLGKRGAGGSVIAKGRGERAFGPLKKKKGMDGGNKNERIKGLAMGVGRFEGGALKLTEREVMRVNGVGKAKAKRKGGKGKKMGGKW